MKSNETLKNQQERKIMYCCRIITHDRLDDMLLFDHNANAECFIYFASCASKREPSNCKVPVPAVGYTCLQSVLGVNDALVFHLSGQKI